MIPNITVRDLYIILLFFLINGLFKVSAGANSINIMTDKIEILNNI